MRFNRYASFRTLISIVTLSTLGLLHCSDDTPDSAPGGKAGSGGSSGGAGKSGSDGGSASAGKGGTSGNANEAGAPLAAAGEGGSAAEGLAGMGGEAPGAGGVGGANGGDEAGAGGEGGAEPHHHALLHSILIGSFAPLPAYAAQPFAGQALLYRTLAGATHVSLQVTGLTAATAYPSHLHNQPCSALGGPHYLIDPAAAAGESNEIWLPFTTDANGAGFAQANVAGHLARGDALSIIVHDPAAANAKMMCADLSVGSNGDLVASGSFAPFAAAEQVDGTITGTVELVRTGSSSNVTLDVSGLDAAAMYHCHVHALPCSVTTAGGHYKLDPTNAATEAANELWPALGDTSDGSATGPTSFVHRARLDAQSVVIHRMVNASTPKVACADLNIAAYPDVEVQGTGVLLAAATPNYTSLTASAELVRSLDGTTSVHVAAAGLMANELYPVHVHNRPCSVQSGGSHYLRDKAAAADEWNELWLPLQADATGDVDAHAEVEHVAAADARSIVIHDPNSDPVNARLACIDLE